MSLPSPRFKARVKALQELTHSLEKSEGPSQATQACLIALDALLISFGEVDIPQPCSRRVWLWPVTLQREFVELISNQQPLALVILAHYAALLRYFEKDRWYIQGWSARVIAAVQCTLQHPWDSWMEWPLYCIREGIDIRTAE
jgi:hypothetical protein